MKITKLPDKYDMNKYYEDKILKENEFCPFCGTKSRIENGLFLRVEISWYGRKDEQEKFSLKKLIPERWKHWKKYMYKCDKCGAEWESEPFNYC